MDDFNLSNISALADYNYYDLWGGVSREEENFVWFCLGHNFDIVATILTMSSLSWQKGFDAGITIADISGGTSAWKSASEYADSLREASLDDPRLPNEVARGS